MNTVVRTPHSVRIAIPATNQPGEQGYPAWNRARGWCERNLAPGTWVYLRGGVFQFNNGADATLFRLHWS